MSSKQQNKRKGIDIFLRIRPSKKASSNWKITEEKKVSFDVPINDETTSRNKQAAHSFQFNHVLPMNAKQDEVFALVAAAPVTSVLNGFNATIFAYGQTGSGKTWTITGGPERYVDRGIIPRALTMIFEQIKERSGAQFQMHISYLEIYNNTGYDLLDPSHETKRLEDLPRVTMREDEEGQVHLRGLSTHLANSEEEALNLLFLGDTNRAIAETPMNMASSRSHCIFTVFVESREAGSDVIRRSKLHLVDLAGSERVHKTHSSGSILREAQHINQSLHYLEVVILALHEKKTRGREHIPYRNSMMTSVLRDSLGGNCKTVMVATINPEGSHTDESISTCRFAQRVALIENKAVLNEEVDPTLVVKRLKQEIKALKEEVNYLREQIDGEEGKAVDLADHEERRLREQVQLYVDQRTTEPDTLLSLGGTPSFTRVHAAFRILREIACSIGGGGVSSSSSSSSSRGGGVVDSAELARLKELLDHRDNEIAILVNMVKRGKTVPSTNFDGINSSRSSNPSRASSVGSNVSRAIGDGDRSMPPSDSSSRMPPIDAATLADKRKSFDVFRKSYTHNLAIEENKNLLRARYDLAKEMGLKVNEARSKINSLKIKIEQLRVERANLGEGKDGGEALDEYDALEGQLQNDIQKNKVLYKQHFSELRGLKGEVERIQSKLKKQRIQMQKQFELWYDTMLRNVKDGAVVDGGGKVQEHHQTSSKVQENDDAKQFLTGDQDVDRDILQFFAAKKALLKR